MPQKGRPPSTLDEFCIQWRRDNHVSLEELGPRMGVSYQTVHRMEQGDGVRLPTLMAFCQAVGIPIERGLELAGVKVKMAPSEDVEAVARMLRTHPEYATILKLLDGLSAEDLEEVRKYAAFRFGDHPPKRNK